MLPISDTDPTENQTGVHYDSPLPYVPNYAATQNTGGPKPGNSVKSCISLYQILISYIHYQIKILVY